MVGIVSEDTVAAEVMVLEGAINVVRDMVLGLDMDKPEKLETVERVPDNVNDGVLTMGPEVVGVGNDGVVAVSVDDTEPVRLASDKDNAGVVVNVPKVGRLVADKMLEAEVDTVGRLDPSELIPENDNVGVLTIVPEGVINDVTDKVLAVGMDDVAKPGLV